MAETEVVREIEAAFAGIGAGMKIAAIRKTAEDVAKQGYVMFRKKEAVDAFRGNPEYADWVCQFIDGEYRFYPPESKKADILAILDDSKKSDGESIQSLKPNTSDVLDTKSIVEIYKKELSDKSKTTFVSITVVQDVPCQVRYRLLSRDKSTGEQSIVQEFTTNFDGVFSISILPSIYNQFMGGLPVIEGEKGEKNHRTIAFQAVEDERQMAFSNLRDVQLELVKSMKRFVDSQYFDIEAIEQKESVSKRH